VANPDDDLADKELIADLNSKVVDTLANGELVLVPEACLWRDFMPVSPAASL
jgi:hypothetical protein